MRTTKGVTLIELMVVIIVMGILATLALPNIKNIAQSARDNARATDVATVQAAVDTFRLSDPNSEAPVIGAQPTDDDETKYSVVDFDSPTGLVPSYLRAVPDSADTTIDGTAVANKYVYIVNGYGKVEAVADGSGNLTVANVATTTAGDFAK